MQKKSEKAKQSTVSRENDVKQETSKRDQRWEKRLQELRAMGSSEALQKAADIALTHAFHKEKELEAGSKLTRRERADLFRQMMTGIQACANAGYRIKQGKYPTDAMIESAKTQPETFIAELVAAAEHNAPMALQVAQSVSQEAVDAVEKRMEEMKNHAAALATVETAPDGTPPQREQTGTVESENQAAAIAPVENSTNSTPPLVQDPPVLGRPSTYTDEEADRVCQWIQSGKSLNKYCQAYGRKADTIYAWIRERPSFAESYRRAHEDRADTLVEDMLDIADKVENAVDMTQVLAAKLRIETRKWIAERMRPEKYGAKVQVEQKGHVTFNLGVPKRQEAQVIDINPVQSLEKPA